MTKLYTSKIPQSVRESMLTFTNDECFLVLKRKKRLTGKIMQSNCHVNVQNFIESEGGERISGWILYRNKSFLKNGRWVWIFHSVWKTPKGEIFDVTPDKKDKESVYSVMWFDKERDIDLVEGTSYNSIVIFENKATAEKYSQETHTKIEAGSVYWTTPSLEHILDINAHSGKYRWIDDAYPNNMRMLEEEYDCKAENGQLVQNPGSLKRINTKMFVKMLFDYSLST